jgi:hypothetical protein
MQRVGINIGINYNRAYTHLFAGPYYPDGNFAAVGNHNFAKHDLILYLKNTIEKQNIFLV